MTNTIKFFLELQSHYDSIPLWYRKAFFADSTVDYSYLSTESEEDFKTMLSCVVSFGLFCIDDASVVTEFHKLSKNNKKEDENEN